MEFGLLGPLEARDNGALVPLGGTKQRALLALLVLNANRIVSRERLVDDLWGDDPPETAVATTQVYVSRLRKVLPAGTLETRSPGYVLHVEPPALDVHRFERLVDDARRAEPGRRSVLLREALSLWRGRPLADLEAEPFARTASARLAELRLSALEDVIDAELALGRHAELTAELETLIAEEPHRERFRTQQALALYRAGRPADALDALRDARAALDDLGLEPSAGLRRLERQILTQDEALDVPALRPLLAGAQERTPIPRQLAPESWSPFVGRFAEVELLCGLVEQADQGKGNVVLLCGEAGAGKTRLVREVAHVAAGRGTLVLYGGSDPMIRTPYQALREWLDHLVDVCDPEALGRLLRGAGAARLARLVPRLAPLVEPEAHLHDPNEERSLLLAAAVDLLAEISRSVPLVVVAEDIHWADSGTLHLLRRLARAAPGCRLLLVAALRDRGEERPRDLDVSLAYLSRLDWARRVTLDGLSSADVHAFVRESAHAEASDALANAIGDLTDGTPLLVCELWRDLLEDGAVAIGAGRAELVRPLAEVRGPQQVRDIVGQRIGRLHPGTVALLELAAVAGGQAELRMIAQTDEFDRATLVDAVEEAVASGLLEEVTRPNAGIRFAHELVRRALYDKLSHVRRADLHGRVALALEAVHANDAPAVLGELAYHFTRAAPVLGTARAVEYNLRAAGAAVASIAFDEAVARLTTALDLGIPDESERKSAQVQLAFLLRETGRVRESDAILAAGVENATGLEQRGEAARMRLFSTGRRMGDPDVDPAEMRAEAEEAVATFAALGDVHGLSQANRLLAMALRRQGRIAECCAAAETALRYADESSDPAQRRRSIGTLCYALCDGPMPVPAALARCEELIADARGDRLLEAVARLARSALLGMSGLVDDAREQIARSLPTLEATDRWMLDFRVYRALLAEALELVGDRGGAERELRAKWDGFRGLGQWEPDARAIHAAAHLAHLYCDQDRWHEADACLDYGREVRIPEYFRHESVLHVGAGARVEARRGRFEEALALARKATAIADPSDLLNLRARTWLAAAEVEERAGRTLEADAARATAADLYRAKGNAAALAATGAARLSVSA